MDVLRPHHRVTGRNRTAISGATIERSAVELQPPSCRVVGRETSCPGVPRIGTSDAWCSELHWSVRCVVLCGDSACRKWMG